MLKLIFQATVIILTTIVPASHSSSQTWEPTNGTPEGEIVRMGGLSTDEQHLFHADEVLCPKPV